MTNIITAELWSKMPKNFHYRGEPNDWVKMTRPGQSLHSFLEGPCFDEQGNIWLVDVPYGRIFKINKGGEWQLHKTYDGEPHSIKIKDSNSFYLTDYKNGLLEYDGVDEFKALAVGHDGDQFKGLSDMAIAPNGDVWITDSGRTSLSDPTGNVYRYKTDGELVHILNNVPYPNGIALSPDGKFVYVAATRANAVWRLMADYPDKKWPMVGTYVQMSGGLGPDGLAVHENGNLAVAHAQAGRAYVYNIFGDTVAQIDIPDGLWITSLIFNKNTLYIVEAQTASIYTAEI
ncbi:MAG: SMP-30/gluconolactonase/LRE family protein [Emcibacteraceae bacterium]|nr:SMP-30/gluconolactonase/LRE family protein [Emcibacteraceae bacterium]